MEAIYDLINEVVNNVTDNPASVFAASGKLPLPAVIITAIAALVLCLFGLKLIRLWNVFGGLVIGSGTALAVTWFLELDIQIVLIASAASGVILAVLAGIFKKFGAFLFCLISVMWILVGILNPQNWIILAVCGAFALVVAILAMIWFEPFVIVATAINGGFGLGGAITALAGIENFFISLAVYLVFAIIGIVVQFLLKSREISKKEVSHAKAVKREISKEAAIEQARAILDTDDEDDD